MDRSRFVRLRIIPAAVAFSIVGLAAAIQAQGILQNFGVGGTIQLQAQDAEVVESNQSTFPAPDRSTLQQLTRSRVALQQGHYGEALEGLSDILATNEDFFFQPDRKAPIFRSLKSEARQLIGQMPKEGLDLYEVRCGADARAMLKQAVANGDSMKLAQVSMLYFHTQAGYEATFLLGLYHLDHGSPLAGALTLKRLHDVPDATARFEPALTLAMATCLLQAGMIDGAQKALIDLKRRQPNSMPRIGGREVAWFNGDAEAVSWLQKLTGPQRTPSSVESDRWTMYRGDPGRNASTVGSAPLLNMRWRVPVSEDMSDDGHSGQIGTMLLQLEQNYKEQGIAVYSGLHPLAVDDVVLMRTVKNLIALDFVTGKHIWEVPTDDPLDSLSRPNTNPYFRQAIAPNVQLGERVWDDATYGTLSSDGRLVFSIEDLSLGVVMPQNQAMVVFGPGGARSESSARGMSNRLAAIGIHSGKLKWELGGTAGRFSSQQPETFFLGSPLPLRGQLFVMAESRDEIKLLALDGDSGNLLWSQQLTMVERNISQDPMRRLSGVSPSYSDGILICPTGAGSVVAVDMATRALLWGYRYGRGTTADQARNQQLMAMQMGLYNQNGPLPRWLDSTATVVDGRVLLTPPEADSLYCLNLADGKPLWGPLPRQDRLYVACVHDGKVVLVGRQNVSAVNLSDGKPAWDGKSITFSPDANVTGRGFYSGNQYYLPLSSAEVMAIDLDSGTGKVVAKARKGSAPGNLVCYRGRVISQGIEGLDVFYQSEAASRESRERLAANPNDSEAIALRGELLLDAGKPTEAIADFRRAFTLDKDGESHFRTRELLRDALLDGLKTDFAAHQGESAEIEKLLDDPVQWAAYLRTMADGLQKIGDWRGSLERYLKLVDLDDSKLTIDAIDPAHLVRRDRWIQARLTSIRRDGAADAGSEIDRMLAARLKTAKDIAGLDGLRRFIDYFGNQPIAAEARSELVRRLTSGGRYLEAEMLLDAERGPADHGAAVADIAEMYASAAAKASTDSTERKQLEDSAAECYRQIEEKYGSVVCRDGKTGKQIIAELASESPIRKRLEAANPVWPVGEVQVKRSAAINPGANPYGRFSVPFQVGSSPFFADAALRFDQNQQEVLGYDAYGQRHWSIGLTEGGQRPNFGYNPNMTQAKAYGHLLLVSMGTKIYALDPKDVSGVSKVLWSQDLMDANADSNMMFGGVVGMLGGWGQQSYAFRMNPFGPVTSSYICFQRFRNIVAVDPVSGEMLWIRRGIPQNSEVWGDEQYVFVLSPDSKEATVFRGLDGEELGKRAIPVPSPPENPEMDGLDRSISTSLAVRNLAMIGRNVLTWSQASKSPRNWKLTLFDPWEQGPVWAPREFAAGSKVTLVGEENVAVFEPDGHFVMLGLADGRPIADVHLQPENSVTEILVNRMGDQYIVVAHEGKYRHGINRRGFQAIPGTLHQPIRHGRVYAIDLHGKLVWPQPVVVEDQHMLLYQPPGLPVLVFGSLQNIGPQMNISILAIDRRNGRIVLDKDIATQTFVLDLSGNAIEKTVNISLMNTGYELAFTSKALPPLKEGQSRSKQAKGKIGSALLEALANPLSHAIEP